MNFANTCERKMWPKKHTAYLEHIGSLSIEHARFYRETYKTFLKVNNQGIMGG